MQAVEKFPTHFTINTESVQSAWTRASLFVHQYSSMKVQIEDANLIKSYDPTDTGYVGYRVSRFYDGQKTEFSAYCLYFSGLMGEPFYSPATWNAHVAAYYIATDTLYVKFLE